MTLSTLLVELGKSRIRVGLDGENLRIKAPKGALTPALREKLSTNKEALLAWLWDKKQGRSTPVSPIEPISRNQALPLSAEQQRMWFIDRMEGGTAVNNVPLGLRMNGVVDLVVLERSLSELERRHEILRTVYLETPDGAQSVIQTPSTQALPLIDFSGIEPSLRAPVIDRLAQTHRDKLFKLTTGPLWWAHVMRLSPNEGVLLVNMHHIIADGWSMSVIIQELGILYTAFMAGQPSPLPAPHIQYVDFAVWQQNMLKNLDNQMGYWEKQLAKTPKLLQLPTDRPRPPVQTYNGGAIPFTLSKELTQAAKDLGRQEECTLFMVLLAAYNVLLSRYSGENNIAVGTPSIYRNRPELEPVIGCFMNTLVMNTELDPGANFRQLLNKVCQVCTEANANQDVPFERLVERLVSNRDLSHTPLFQVMLILVNTPSEALALPGLSLAHLESKTDTVAKFDLTIYASETPEGTVCRLVYNTDLFDQETASSMVDHFVYLLEAAVAAPQTGIPALPLGPEIRLPSFSQPTDQQRVPLSYHQERLWFIDIFEARYLYPSHPVYHNIPLHLHLSGSVDTKALEQGIVSVIGRHQILHTQVCPDGDSLFQALGSKTVPFEIMDRDSHTLDQLIDEAHELAARPIDPTKAPLMRATLLQQSPQEALLTLTFHHLIVDRPSLALIAEELCECYAAARAGRPVNLPQPAVQYRDFSEWQRNLPRKLTSGTELAWRDMLRGRLQALEIPLDRPRPAIHTFTIARHAFQVPAPLVEKLNRLAQDSGTSLYAVTFTAFKVLLHRYANQDEIMIGVSDSYRNARPELARAVGPFANLLAIRGNTAGNPSFREALQRAADLLTRAHKNRDIPFEKLTLLLKPEKDMSRTALYDNLFHFNDTPPQHFQIDNVTAQLLDTNIGYGKNDLHLALLRQNGGLQGQVVYNADFFDPTTAQRMFQHYVRVLVAAADAADVPIDDMQLLSTAERETELRVWNQTGADYPTQQTLHGLFTERVAAHPNRAAITLEGESMSYGDLDARANRLAHALIKAGVQADTLVALCLERCMDLPAAMLGILGAGASYLPLDPENPPERLAFILEDSGVQYMVTTRNIFPAAPPNVTMILLDEQADALAAQPADTPKVQVSPDHLAYCIYTSGSTGRPKGVLVTHRNVVRLMINDHLQFSFSQDDVWTMFHNGNFDFSVWEMYGAFLYGGRLAIVPKALTIEPGLFVQMLEQEGVTVLNQTPSSFQVVSSEVLSRRLRLPSLRYVIFGGEALNPLQLADWRNEHPDVKLINMYGITETTVHVTFKEITEEDIELGLSNIGLPIPTTTTYIMDNRLRLVPIGVTGEICVGGLGVSRGYLNRPELTAERFVRHPDLPDTLLYRSGDLGKRLANGDMVHLGRMDDQVQLRGFRVELGEIRAAALAFEGVRDAVVTVVADKAQIATYVVPESVDYDADALRTHLTETLPYYMVPSYLVRMDALPLTANKKVDVRALPDPAAGADQGKARISPRNQTEETLVGIWTEVLETEQFGVTDSFFEIGGHSLLATQVISRIEKHFGVSLPIKVMFESNNIAALAQRLTQTPQAQDTTPPLVAVQREGDLPLSFAQQRLWFLFQLAGPNTAYNMPLALKATGALELGALTDAIQAIVNRHEILRTRFAKSDTGGIQIVESTHHVNLTVTDLSGLADEEATRVGKELAASFSAVLFDLERTPLWAVHLVRSAPQEHLLLINMHHIISDGWSMGLFVKELAAAYPEALKGRRPTAPPIPLQYGDYAVWQRNWLQGETLENIMDFWKNLMAEVPPISSIPTDRPHPPVHTFNGANFNVMLPPALAQSANDMARTSNASLFMVTMATFYGVLFRYTGQTRMALGSPIANRNRAEVEQLIGFFVNTLVLPAEVNAGMTFRELLSQVRQTSLDAYAHQDIPFEQLVDQLSGSRNLSHSPLFQIMFAVQNMPSNLLHLPGLELNSLGTEAGIAKFDLSVSIRETENSMMASYNYNTDLYDEATVENLAQHYQNFLTAVLQQPDTPLGYLDMLTQAERSQILEDWNHTVGQLPQTQTLGDIVSTRTAENPGALALVDGEHRFTYEELDTAANRLAHYLCQLGVRADQPVAIATERSKETIIGMLAILRAGGAYVPIDPDYPSARFQLMLEDCGATLLLTHARAADRLPETALPLVQVDAHSDKWADQPGTPPQVTLSGLNLAYAMYTSGSTGRPKGVSIPHQSVIRLLFGTDYIHFGPNLTFLQTAPLTFDASIIDIWGPLLHGGCCVLFTERVLTTTTLKQLVAEENIDVLGLTPALCNILIDEDVTCFEGLSWMHVGGDVVSPSHLWRLRESVPSMRIIHCYGPTESTLFATTHSVPPATGDAPAILPIGTPIGNTQCYVLDEQMNPLPVGAFGELFIGGLGLARGYLGRPELTAAAFVPSPFGAGGERLYRTGDLVRYKKDGSILFGGRRDHQVKVRGFRIEPGEVAAAIDKYEPIHRALVLALDDTPGEKRLVGVIQVDDPEGFNTAELREHLNSLLPAYMMPAAFVALKAFPVTPNGKVDKAALVALCEANRGPSGPVVLPRSDLEDQIAVIWREVLALDIIDIDSNFFEVGGNSLHVVNVHARLQGGVAPNLAVIDLFKYTTIRDLAAFLEDSAANASLEAALIADVEEDEEEAEREEEKREARRSARKSRRGKRLRKRSGMEDDDDDDD